MKMSDSIRKNVALISGLLKWTGMLKLPGLSWKDESRMAGYSPAEISENRTRGTQKVRKKTESDDPCFTNRFLRAEIRSGMCTGGRVTGKTFS